MAIGEALETLGTQHEEFTGRQVEERRFAGGSFDLPWLENGA
jgi:hypothetical protein